ncbi:MAG: hypothetical protein ACP5K5_02720 [Candidatus Micrarchaeia archaeon]
MPKIKFSPSAIMALASFAILALMPLYRLAFANPFMNLLAYILSLIFILSSIIAINNIARTPQKTRFWLFIFMGALMLVIAIAEALIALHIGIIRNPEIASSASLAIVAMYAFGRAKKKVEISDKTSFGYIE